jgi:hypothetical protein
MKFVMRIAAVAVVMTLHSSSPLAQEPATVVLRSGESLGLELIDLQAAGFTVRQNGVEFQIPFDLVAAVNFVGGEIPDSDWRLVTSGRHVLALRSGLVVQGRLYDVGGALPLRVLFEGDGGRRDDASTDVAWILLAPRAPSPILGTAVDLNGSYFAPSSGTTLNGAVTSATTHPRGDRRGEGQVYEVNKGVAAPEGTYTPFSDAFRKPRALGGLDLRGNGFQCDLDLHDTNVWQIDAEFFQIGAGRQADPDDTETEEFFVFIYRSGRQFALYMETDWDLYRDPTTYYAATDETKFRVRVDINAAGTEALLTVTPLDGRGSGTVHTVNPLPLDLRSDNVRSASFFAGFTQNRAGVNSNARATLDNCVFYSGL